MEDKEVVFNKMVKALDVSPEQLKSSAVKIID